MGVGYYIRGTVSFSFTIISAMAIFVSILVGAPLYLVNKRLYRAWLDLGKRNWATTLIYVTGHASPLTSKIYVSDPSLRTKFVVDKKTNRIHSRLNPRAVVMSNHQLYNDWAYLWWLSYTSNLHGAIIIMLKQSIRSVPMFGFAMRMWRFVFLKRDWKHDEKVIATSMKDLTADPDWPMWLLIFPEGTVVNQKMLARSQVYYDKLPAAAKKYPLPRNLLLPRTTGLYAVLKNASKDIPVVYDITSYFPGIPADSCGEKTYSLGQTYGAGEGPKELRMHIREFALDSIPLDDPDTFAEWLYKVYYEKDQIIDKLKADSGELGEPFVGKFGLDLWHGIENPFELYGSFNVPITVAILGRLVYKWLRSS